MRIKIKIKSSLKIIVAVSVFLLMMVAASAQGAKVDNTSGNKTEIPIPILPPVVSVDSVSLQVNETGTVDVDLVLLPIKGFAYANISVDIVNSSVAEFTGVSFSDWAVLNQNSTPPSSTMWFKVGDLNNSIKVGENINFGTFIANDTLATLKVKGLAEGSTSTDITINSVQADDNYKEIKDQFSTSSGVVIVKPEAVATVSAKNVTVSKGGTRTVDISVDEVPSGGLSYANLTVDIANSTVAQIQDVSSPSWSTLSKHSSTPSSTIWFKVGDLSDNVQAGNTDVSLATVTVEGLHNGTSNIELTVNSFQAEDYSEIGDSIATKPGEVKVGVSGPPQIGGKQPKDLNGNGLYEDVNGDNSFNFGDVIFFFKNFDNPAVTGNKQFYDFNGDGAINFGDVIALFNQL